MALKLTQTQKRLTEASTKEPQLVIEIDGLGKNFFSSNITWEMIKVGDVDLKIDGSWKIGGLRKAQRDDDLIGLGGTTTTLSQLIDIDKGRGSSITSFSVNIIDISNVASELFSPGVGVDEILFKKARVYLGYKEQPFPDEFTVIFRGVVEEVESRSGSIHLALTSPERKKKEKLFIKADSELTALISDNDTEISVQDISLFRNHVLRPDGLKDPDLTFHFTVDDEIIEYESIDYDNNKFLNCTRGRLGTVATSHANGAKIESLTQLKGNPLGLALKLMLSGKNDYFVKDLKTQGISDELNIGINNIKIEKSLIQKHNVTVGDYASITNSDNSNDFAFEKVSAILEKDSFNYLIIENVSLNDESGDALLISFRSKFDSLGYGFQMDPEEVDIERHEFLKSQYLPSASIDLRFKDEIDGREFMEKEIYLASQCFSLIRSARSSLGILSPPAPSEETVLVGSEDIIDPDEIKIKRSISKNFSDSILYKYDYDPIKDKYQKSLLTVAGDPLHGTGRGSSGTLVVESKGLRSEQDAVNQIQTSSKRRLDIYKNAAEFVQSLKVTFSKGLAIEAGDIVILDLSELKTTNFKDGTRKREPELWLVTNKRFDIKNGDVRLDLLNSSYSMDASIRYALISPASKVKQAISQNEIVIEPLQLASPGQDEGSLWSGLIGASVILYNDDFSIVEQNQIMKTSFNTITFKNDFSQPIDSSFKMALDLYNNSNSLTKLKYGFMTNQLEFDDERPPYIML